MSQYFEIHTKNPQPRLIRQAVSIVIEGGLIVYPTDSAYALGCQLGNKTALDRIKQIRQLTDKHNFTLMCRDLSEIATYAQISNQEYRLLKSHTPGPYTFVLGATREVPRRLMHPKRRTIGIRVPNCPVTLSLLEALGEPMISSTLILPGSDMPLVDPYEIRERLEHVVDLVIDGGAGSVDPTTVVSLENAEPQVLRQGCGDISDFQ